MGRQGQHQEDTGENYLASVSDLMSGLIFFFILALIVFAMTYSRATGELTEGLEVRDQILRQIQTSLEDAGVHVHIDPEQGVLRLPEAILFPVGSADLSPEGQRALMTLARALARVLPGYVQEDSGMGVPGHGTMLNGQKLDAIFIEGHTDNVPIRNQEFADNWELSTARAVRTYQALVAVEPRLDRMRNYAGQPLFSVSGYADRRPVASNDSLEGRSLNRRIDIRIVMATPTLDDVLSSDISGSVTIEQGGRRTP